MLYRCDSNNSGCREGAAPERGEASRTQTKGDIKGKQRLVQQSLLLSSSNLGAFWLRGCSHTANCRVPTELPVALQVCTRKLHWIQAGHLTPIPPGAFPPLLTLIPAGEAPPPQHSHRRATTAAVPAVPEATGTPSAPRRPHHDKGV